jgi:hypothetical protein
LITTAPIDPRQLFVFTFDPFTATPDIKASETAAKGVDTAEIAKGVDAGLPLADKTETDGAPPA